MKKKLIVSVFVGNNLSNEDMCQCYSRILTLVSQCSVNVRRQDCRGFSQVQYVSDKHGACDIECCNVLALIPGIPVTPKSEPDLRRRLAWKLGSEFHAAAIDRIDFIADEE